MDTQRFDQAIKQPTPLPVGAKFPLMLVLSDEEEEGFVSRYPSPPPPTPCIPRRRTPLDAQRYDPFKGMLVATSPPRYSSPDPVDPDNHPIPPDSVAFPLPPRDAYDELLAYHFGDPDSESSDDLTSDSEGTVTPSDDTSIHGHATTYHRTGTSEYGDFSIERTIVRPRSFRADLSRALTSLAARSTATLRTMPSMSHLSGATTPSEDDSAVAPPTSAAASRRPSLAGAPLAIGEVTDSLKRLAARIVPHADRGQVVDRTHFEEVVDRCEDVWARAARGEPLVEVFFTRKRETCVEEGCDYECGFGYNGVGDVGHRGVGIYS